MSITSNVVWNLTYLIGSTGSIVGDAGNPQSRECALKAAEAVAKVGWRAWAEHQATGELTCDNAGDGPHASSLATVAMNHSVSRFTFETQWLGDAAAVRAAPTRSGQLQGIQSMLEGVFVTGQAFQRSRRAAVH